MKAENSKDRDYQSVDSAEHEERTEVHRSFRSIWKERDSAEPELLEKILERNNLNRAYKRVKAKKGAPGVDGMTVNEMGVYFKENKTEIIGRIKRGKYTPDPVRRVEIPKPDGGIRKLGVPTVKDRVFQQAITQTLTPIYEKKFSENSYGYRPGKSAQDAILKVKAYAEEGYKHGVLLDLSKYFDTLNHEKLLNILRRDIKDERVIHWIKRYLKSGVMEDGLKRETEECSPQGGNLSPLLANIYLNEFDKEFESRGVKLVRYADDIVILAKSERAAKRLLESSTNYLEGKLKLTVNKEKSKVVSIYSLNDFKFLGFALGKNKNGVFIRVHPKSWKKMKSKLKELSSRKRIQNLRAGLDEIKVYIRGWLNYYRIASMKNRIEKLNSWLYHRIRACIWKRWKLPRTRYRNLRKLGISKHNAYITANSRRSYWFTSNTVVVVMALTKERLIRNGFYDISIAYQSMH